MMKLTKANISVLSDSIDMVWDQIASDAYDLYDRVTPEVIVEMCIDADRLTTLANNKAAQKLVDKMIKESSFSEVVKYLTKTLAK